MSSVSFDRRSLLALLAGASASLLAGQASAAENVATGNKDFVGDQSIGNIQLQSIGALGVGYIQSTLGLVGVLADTVSREIYSPKQVEDLMNGTITGLDGPKRMLRNLQESNISGDDAEFLDRMISVFNALQQEARALAVFAKSRKPEDAANYEKERRRVLRKLAELTRQDEIVQPESAPRTPPKSKPSQTPSVDQSQRPLRPDNARN